MTRHLRLFSVVCALGAAASPVRAAVPDSTPVQPTLADSVYREARTLLNRGDWRRAATLFAQIAARKPPSPLAPDALYWQAFALYRIGGIPDLRSALATLEDRQKRFPKDLRMESESGALTTRVLAALADRGDAAAAQRLRTVAAGAVEKCDEEDTSVRAAALSALLRTDPAQARSLLQKVLLRRDPCSVQLRRTALFALDDLGDPSVRGLLFDVARNDPTVDLRTSAVGLLSRTDTDASAMQLETLLTSEGNPTVQRTILRSLGTMRAPRARQAIRSMIERATAPEALRVEALLSLRMGEGKLTAPALPRTGAGTESEWEAAWRASLVAARSGLFEDSLFAAVRRTALQQRMAAEWLGENTSSPRISSPMDRARDSADAAVQLTSKATAPSGGISSDDAAWLRGVYPRLETVRLKTTAICVLIDVDDPATLAWWRSLALREDEPTEIRVLLFAKVGRVLSIADLSWLYERAPNRELRQQIITWWGRREEPEALDRLAEVVRTETDPVLRRAALGAIQESKDPRATRILMGLIDR